MSMLFMESFGAAVGDLTLYGKWWDRASSRNNTIYVVGRTSGANALQTNAAFDGFSPVASYMTADLGSPRPVLFFAFAYLDQGHPAGQEELTWYDDAFGIQMRLAHDVVNRLYLQRAGNTTLLTASTATILNRWHFVEIGIKTDAATGWLEMRLDGVLVGSYYGTTGTSRATANGNTRGTTVNGIRFPRFGHVNVIGNTSTGRVFEDIIVMDDQGAVNNNFLGDRRVFWLPPNAAGTHTDFAVGGTAPNLGAGVPTAAPTFTKADTGGTVAAGTYLAAVAWRTASGSTQIGPTATVTTVTGTSTLTTNPGAFPTNVTGWDLYLSQPGGSTLTRQNAAPLPTGAFTLTTPPTNTGQAPPTANTTTSNWRAVSASPAGGDASYVQANAAGLMDTYNITDLPPSVISVDAVRVATVMRKTDAGFRFGAPVVHVTGVDVTIGSTPLQQSYGQLAAMLETRPDNNPWTVADVNALEVGATIVS